MLCHIGLQAIATEISSYMICQSYWKMSHWQSDHEFGTRITVLRDVRDVLSIMTDGQVEGDPLHSNLNALDFYLWGNVKPLCM
jgi:hypothetical protein